MLRNLSLQTYGSFAQQRKAPITFITSGRLSSLFRPSACISVASASRIFVKFYI